MQNAISQNLVFCLGRCSYQTKRQIPKNRGFDERVETLKYIAMELTIKDRGL